MIWPWGQRLGHSDLILMHDTSPGPNTYNIPEISNKFYDQWFDLEVKGQGHSDLILIHDISPGHNTYNIPEIKNTLHDQWFHQALKH